MDLWKLWCLTKVAEVIGERPYWSPAHAAYIRDSGKLVTELDQFTSVLAFLHALQYGTLTISRNMSRTLRKSNVEQHALFAGDSTT